MATKYNIPIEIILITILKEFSAKKVGVSTIKQKPFH